jgi:Na+/H+-dicarboxylate symporter
MGFYLVTSLIAILLGLFLVNLVTPGVGADLSLKSSYNFFGDDEKSLGQTLLDIFPNNIVEAFADGNMLGIILFSILLGYFITQIPKAQSQVLINFFDAFSAVMMQLTMFIIRFTPIGIFAIVARVVSEQAGMPGGLATISGSLGLYMLVVICGILIHGLLFLPLFMRMFVKIKPYKHFRNMSTVLLTAFSTSSSNATLPLTMSEIQEKDGVSEKIASFTLPLGATINMNGTALYECVAVMFIAQAYGIQLTVIQQAIVVLTSLLAAIGSAGIPMAGVVMMGIILSAVGLPMEGIGLVLVVDRPLDMLRTSLNVYGDTCAAAVIAKSEGENLSI